jgi:hypothetical protein
MIRSGTADELHQILLACAGERRVDEFFEQRVGLAIDHAVALLNRRAADSPARGGSCQCRAGRETVRPLVVR